jgi:hypothetical protein
VADATGNGCVAPSGLNAARWQSTRLIPTRPGRAGIATAGAVRPRKQAYSAGSKPRRGDRGNSLNVSHGSMHATEANANGSHRRSHSPTNPPHFNFAMSTLQFAIDLAPTRHPSRQTIPVTRPLGLPFSLQSRTRGVFDAKHVPAHLAPDLYPEPPRCNLHAVDS